MKRIGAALWLLLAAFSAAAADYWIAPEGDDRADGSAETPWKTLDHANRMLHPGDILWLADGTYRGSIAPVRSGTPEEPVIYCAVNPGKAQILPEPGRSAVELYKKDFIIADGAALCGSRETSWLDLREGKGILLIDLEMSGVPGKGPGVIARSNHLIFRRWSVDGGGTGGVFRLQQCGSLTLEGSDFRNFSSPVMAWEDLRQGRIRRNRIAAHAPEGVFQISGNPPDLTVTGNLFSGTYPSRLTGSGGNFLYRNIFSAPEDLRKMPENFWHCTVITASPDAAKGFPAGNNNWIGTLDAGKFRDPASGDFRLTVQSPALDAGMACDRLASSGSGGLLKLEQGGLLASYRRHFRNAILWFGESRQIIRMEFQQERAGNTLLVEPELSAFRKGDAVALPWHGNAPDRGAHEYGMLNSDNPPVPGEAGVDRLTNRDRNPEFRLENPFRRWNR